MKHFITILLLSASITMNAQTSMVVRYGNTYVVDGYTMDKVEFANFLQNQEPNLSKYFADALKLSKKGWPLFGVGVGLEVAGAVTTIATAVASSGNSSAGVLSGAFVAAAGECIMVAGIACLGVGYGRMHHAANVYNVQQLQKQRVTVNLTTNGNGVGLALTW